ncbi:MAG: hypothetical protein P8R54_25465 [Myxococcota bacterium]|nr:hypothetical protein [Myxococcota bacterium]
MEALMNQPPTRLGELPRRSGYSHGDCGPDLLRMRGAVMLSR